jgi:uncharacterized protein with HEPN domain
MNNKDKKYLFDILLSIEAIFDFIGDMDYPAYTADLKTKSAVERQFGIIGEAVNKFIKENPIELISHAKEIVNLRNRLIHAYDSVDDSILWAIKLYHLPQLKDEVEKLIDFPR